LKEGTIIVMNVSPTSPFEAKFLSSLCAGTLRICGGEDPVDPPTVKVEVVDPPKDDTKTKDDGNKDDDDPLADLQSKYETEKQQRIQLQKDLEKRDEEKTKATATVESERDSYKQKYEKLLSYVEKDGLENAINKLSAEKIKDGEAQIPRYQWQDVEAVRTFIDPNKIKLDLDNHQVDGLAEELKRIAKEKPYLLVPKQTQQQQEPPAGPPSGGQPGGQVRQRETDKTKLGNKYRIPGFASAAAGARPI
jgi:hypothetical protein